MRQSVSLIKEAGRASAMVQVVLRAVELSGGLGRLG
jgi:hypothetical protein